MKRMMVALLAFGLMACGNENNSVEPTVSLAGTYTLRTINGSGLPFTFSDGTTVTSDVISIFDDGTFSESIQISDGEVFVDQGTYSSNNGSITFNDITAGIQYSASLSGTVLTAIFQNGLTEVFQKT